MADAIDGFRSQIMDNYKQGITHITTYGNIILGIGISVEDTIVGVFEGKFDIEKDVDAIGKALQDFRTEASKVINELIDYKDKLMKNLQGIRDSAASITVPAAIAPAALDNGSWQPRKPTP
jgi:hypothetical protein